MRIIAILVSLVVTTLLGGCITSDTPLIPASEAAMVLSAGAYVGGTTEDPDEMHDAVVVKRRSDDYFVTKTVLPNDTNKFEKPEVTNYTMRLQQLDEDHFIAQVREAKKTTTPYEYAFVYIAPDGIVKIYGARCDRLLKSGRALRAYDMTATINGTDASWCGAGSADGLTAFMREFPLILSEFTEFYYAVRPLSQSQ
jgi:hypothetical protein